jgi:NADH pyrophosphatase NudC (nudix superfamily)
MTRMRLLMPTRTSVIGLLPGYRYGGKSEMMQPEGSILAQVQEILKEEFELSIYKYQMLEFCKINPFMDIKQEHRMIDMQTEILIALGCSKLFSAVYSYKICPHCQGDKYVWTGDDSYRCPKCNIRGEVRK